MEYIVCGICLKKGDTKTACPVTVKSGELRISTHLCQECAAKAEDAQEETTVWEVKPTPLVPLVSPKITITNS